MTDKNEFMFLSSDGKTMLHGIAWLPEGEVRAVIQLSHGITEHIDRYDTFARFLSERGLAVYGYDCLGHGQSVTANGIPLDFGDGSSWHTTVNDLYVLHTRLKAAYPDVPHFLIGHSMGSFMVRTYLIRYPGTVQGAVLVGTGWVPEFKLIPALALVNLHAKKSGHTPGDTGMGLVFGRYNSFFRPNRTEYDWLSSDDEIIDAYMSDPLCQNTPTVNLFLAMMQGIRFNQQYGKLVVRTSANFHDRFLIIDDREVYLIGASLKDLGKKCFAFTKLDAGEIPGIKARA